MLTNYEFFRCLIESEDPEGLVRDFKALARKHIESNVATRFEPNKVPSEIIRGVGGSIWDTLNRLEQAVDEIAKLAEEVSKYNPDGSLKADQEGPPDGEDQPVSEEAVAEPTESDK